MIELFPRALCQVKIKVKMRRVLVLVVQVFTTFVSCANFNITNLSNCVDIAMNYQNDAEVEVKDIIYEKNADGFYDTLSGKFVVHIYRDHQETEAIITFFKCAKGVTEICTENSKKFVESLDCNRFLTDDSGPWHMFAPALDKRNVCAEIKGEYDIKAAKMEGRFLKKYMTVEDGHYRIQFLHHLPGESMDIKNLRGCVELDFDIVV